MSEIVAIPEDIHNAAFEVAMDIPWEMVPTPHFDSAVNLIETAILAERQRCVDIVESFGAGGWNYEPDRDGFSLRFAIRAAILADPNGGDA